MTNVEPDHLDYFGTEEAYREVFERFAGCVVTGGTLVVCLDDAGSRALAQSLSRSIPADERDYRILGYGTRAAVEDAPEVEAGAIIEDMRITPAGTEVSVRFFDDEAPGCYG